MRVSVRTSSERCSSPVRTPTPDRLPLSRSRGALDPDPDLRAPARRLRAVSTTTPVAPVSARLRSAITRMTVAESSPAAATACCTSITAWNSSVSSRISCLGQLALGDVELGAEVADLAARPRRGSAPRRWRTSGPARSRVTSRYSWSRRDAALGQPRPFGQQRGAVVGVDVLEELLVAEVLRHVAGEALEGGVDEGELQVHVVRDHALRACWR